MRRFHCHSTACTACAGIPILADFLQMVFRCLDSHSPAVLLADLLVLPSSSVSRARPSSKRHAHWSSRCWLSCHRSGRQAVSCNLLVGHPAWGQHSASKVAPSPAGVICLSWDCCGEESETAASHLHSSSLVGHWGGCSAVRATLRGIIAPGHECRIDSSRPRRKERRAQASIAGCP